MPLRGPAAWRSTQGTTLIELMVVIAVLGIMAGVAGLAATPPAPAADGTRDSPARAIAVARRLAVEQGVPISFTVLDGTRVTLVTAHPDGRLIGAEHLAFDPLSGRKLGRPTRALGVRSSPPAQVPP